eukprot:TRINITY_DN22596_c0_g1_i1.p1 TRINITY_DN22596_c0_g1~~TRINITY_DN22596_c0_g1_i1.p1  ORF type:complete len:308 (+),score=77.86 TRINITY_DN22596_c0_g1_i1:21-944(+)
MQVWRKHKWKMLIAASIIGAVGCLYRMKRQTQPSVIDSVKKDRPQIKEASALQTLTDKIKQRIRKDIEFITSTLLESIPLAILETRLNVSSEFNTTEELQLVLGYVFAETILQRFAFLLTLVNSAVQCMNCCVLEEESKGSVAKEKSSKLEDAIILKAVKEYIAQLAEKLQSFFKKCYASRLLVLSSKEAVSLLATLCSKLQEKYCKLVPKEGTNELNLESYHMKLVNTFTAKLKHGGELKEFIESVYFQSLLAQGIDADFYKLNAEYQKICLLYTSPSPRDLSTSRMPSSACKKKKKKQKKNNNKK